MSKKIYYYAVAYGRKPGIYHTWNEAKEQIDGYNGAKFKKFESLKQAENFIKGNGSLILGQFGITNVVPELPKSLTTNEIPYSKDTLLVFTDGACKDNGSINAKAGYSAIFPNHSYLNISEPLKNGMKTNNRAEYTAFIRALEQCEKEDPTNTKTVYLFTDSKLLHNTVTQWIKGWKNNGWKKNDGSPILNLDLIILIDKLITKRTVKCQWVRAHTDRTDWMSIWNAKADLMANNACLM